MNKLLALLQILIKQTDENHKLTTNQLIEKLAELCCIYSVAEHFYLCGFQSSAADKILILCAFIAGNIIACIS